MKRKKRTIPRVPKQKQELPITPSKNTKEPSGYRLRKYWFVLAAIGAGLAILGWDVYWKYVALPGLDFKNANIVIFTLDTTRADHLGLYGYKGVATPCLDELASDSFVFRRAIAHVPLTLPSHSSIFTGTLPVYHGARDNGAYILQPQAITLAESLKANGYQTAAFVSAFVLDSKWGLDQGFDTYFDSFDASKLQEGGLAGVQRPAQETNVEVLRWIQNLDQKKPFFLWVHYYDPHHAYEPPEPYKSEYSSNLYDGEIAYMDAMLGRIMAALKAKGVSKNTIFVATGDHGEGLGEHREKTHALFIYESVLHVPLILKLPGVKGRDISKTVQHIDLMPTLLDLLGIQKNRELQGQSWIPILQRKEIGESMVVSESYYSEKHYGWSPLIALTTDRYKFIEAPKPELYDLQKDAREINNLYSSMQPMGRTLRERLQDQLQNFAPSAQQQKETTQLDLESQEMLRALGYIGTGPSESMKEKGRQIDPKDKIDLAEALHLATYEKKNGRLEKAKETLDWILRQDPEIVDAQFMKAAIAFDEQNYAKAIEGFQETLRLRSDHQDAIQNLAQAYRKIGETEKAIKGFEEVLRRDPNYLSALLNLGEIYMELKQPEKAVPYYSSAIARLESSLKTARSVESIAFIREQLSGIYFAQNRLDEAAKELLHVLKEQPKRPNAHYNLAQIHEKRGNWLEAVKEYKLEIEYHPENPKPYNDLAILLRQNKLYADSVPFLHELVRLQPGGFGSHFMLADSIVQAGGDLQSARAEVIKALEINPQFQRASQLLAFINVRLSSGPSAR